MKMNFGVNSVDVEEKQAGLYAQKLITDDGRVMFIIEESKTHFTSEDQFLEFCKTNNYSALKWPFFPFDILSLRFVFENEE